MLSHKYYLEIRFNPKNRDHLEQKLNKLKKSVEIFSYTEGVNYICFKLGKAISNRRYELLKKDKDFYFVIHFKI